MACSTECVSAWFPRGSAPSRSPPASPSWKPSTGASPHGTSRVRVPPRDRLAGALGNRSIPCEMDQLARLAQKRVQDQHLELLILAILTEGLDLRGIDRANDVEQAEEHGPRVRQVIERLLEDRGPHGLDVEADALAVLAVAVLLEHPDLVERPAQVHRAEDLVLVVFQAVLVVQVNAPELAVVESEGHVIGWVKAGQDRMGTLDQDARA